METSNQTTRLTWAICSVCHDRHGEANYTSYINTNWDLMIEKPDYWHVASPDDTKLEQHFIRHECKKYRSVETDGVSSTSFLHGMNLNNALDGVSGVDYVLLLDPDFFIMPNISLILKHMDKNNYSFWGAPYHQSDTPLIRNFPVGFCLFIDLRQVEIATIDMSPGYKEYVNPRYYPDVGYGFYAKHRGGSLKYSYMLPSVDFTNPTAIASFQNENYEYETRNLSDYGITYENPVNKKGTKIDEYFYNRDICSIHLRTKNFQKTNKEDIDRVPRQISTIKTLAKSIRNIVDFNEVFR